MNLPQFEGYFPKGLKGKYLVYAPYLFDGHGFSFDVEWFLKLSKNTQIKLAKREAESAKLRAYRDCERHTEDE